MDYCRSFSSNQDLLTREFRVIATVKGLGSKMGIRPASLEVVVAGRFLRRQGHGWTTYGSFFRILAESNTSSVIHHVESTTP